MEAKTKTIDQFKLHGKDTGEEKLEVRPGKSRELTQIKRHRGRETEGRQKGSLTHGKKTPANGVNEHEQGTEKGLAAEASSALLASQPRGQKSDVGRTV